MAMSLSREQIVCCLHKMSAKVSDASASLAGGIDKIT